MKKKFLIFAGEQFYANGGANDFVSNFANKDLAIKHAKHLMGKQFSTNRWRDACEDHGVEYDVECPIEWVQVFDLELCEVVFRRGRVHGDDSGIVIL